MKNAGYTKQERSFIMMMRIWAVAFLGAGILFALVPDYTLDYITNVGRGIFGFASPPVQLGQERFWTVLAVALLFMMSYVCAIVQHNPVRNMGYTRPIILAKFVSAVGFAFCFFHQGRRFFYLTGAVVDGAIFLITWRLYARAVRSRA